MSPMQCLRQDWLGGPLWLVPFAAGMVFTVLVLWFVGYFKKNP